MSNITKVLNTPIVITIGFTAVLSLFMIGCSDEDRSQIDTLIKVTDAVGEIQDLATSTFNDHCTEPLDDLMNIIQQREDLTMSSQEQNRAVDLINVCITEIGAEFDLTEKEFPNLQSSSQCAKSVEEGRQSLEPILAKLHEFEFLPNRTKLESNTVGASYASLTITIVAVGGGAAINRAAICTLEKVAPEALAKKSY